MNKFKKIIANIGLFLLPNLIFPQLNVFFFRILGVKVGYSARIMSSVQIMGDINISIGKDVYIGHETLITGGVESIVIGDYCDISDRVIICNGTHEINLSEIRRAGKGLGKKISIGKILKFVFLTIVQKKIYLKYYNHLKKK